ncbi:MAG TPA: NAD(P)H-dependent oxidoreductase [Thermoleophilaceae bacterium]
MTRIAAFGGSLRRGAFNTSLLRAACQLAPDDAEVTLIDIAELPLYNADLDEHYGGGPEPAAATELRNALECADALLIVTPEYNWSVPGYIKNAIDWVSRPAMKSPLAGKPALIMGASGGPAGTGRAQLHLRQVLLSTRTRVLVESLELPFAAEHIDDRGRLDPDTADEVRRLMARLDEEVELTATRQLAHST